MSEQNILGDSGGRRPGLCWLDFWYPTVCSILLGQLGKMKENRNQSQPNPGPRPPVSPCIGWEKFTSTMSCIKFQQMPLTQPRRNHNCLSFKIKRLPLRPCNRRERGRCPGPSWLRRSRLGGWLARYRSPGGTQAWNIEGEWAMFSFNLLVSKVKFILDCSQLKVLDKTRWREHMQGQSRVQKCRKICGLGCVTRALVHSWFTQPSPRIFLHFCTII